MQGFDLVHCSNALDHTQDPGLAYHKMMTAVKPGGYLIIQGFENEAINENWEGFHQWNISCSGIGRLALSGKNNNPVLIDETNIFHRLQLETGKHWFIFIKQKQ